MAEVEELQKKLETYLTGRLGGAASISRMFSLSGGACQDNYLVDLKVDSGENAGDYELVMRTDKGGSLLSSLSRVDEFAVAGAAFQAGVKTPRPFWVEPDTGPLGNPFYFMQRVGGKATGRYIVKDKSLRDYRSKQMPQDIAENLAKIHSITPDNCPDRELVGRLLTPDMNGPEGNKAPALRVVRQLREGLDELPEAHPAIELTLNWLEANAQDTTELVMVHGDFRTGNFMVSPDGLEGIVDWEFTHWGDRHEDISWLCMRAWRFSQNNRPVGGFAKREDFYEAYEKASGHKVEPARVHYWEVIGNVGWALGSAQQAERHMSGADRGIEYASIGRLTGEMEYEMMRLIENAG